jgi:hypothetical protein
VKVKHHEETTGLTDAAQRLILAMASEMAACLHSTQRACIIFQALALEAGVNVINAFE